MPWFAGHEAVTRPLTRQVEGTIYEGQVALMKAMCFMALAGSGVQLQFPADVW